MAKRDYYEVLSVPRDADEAALKSAYRKIALQNHPDHNPDDPEAEARFKEASEAYAVLSDPEKRRAFDRFGFDALGGGAGAGGRPDFGDMGGFADVFNDLFGDLFGARGGRRRRGQRGADLRYNLEIDLDDVLEGQDAKLKLPKMRACGTCDGSGLRPGTQPEICGRCHGTGQMVLQQGFFRVSRPCDHCAGTGEIVRERCADCRGAGRVEGQQTISVRVPPGVEDGARLRLTGEGEAGVAGGPPGDLYVVISVTLHPFFTRDGPELHCDVPISLSRAALGGEVEVPTLDGKVKLKIPEGSQPGKVLRLRGKGLPTLRSSARGDQLVRIVVEVPSKLSQRQRQLLEEFQAESGSESLPLTSSFLDKLREWFG